MNEKSFRRLKRERKFVIVELPLTVDFSFTTNLSECRSIHQIVIHEGCEKEEMSFIFNESHSRKALKIFKMLSHI